MIPKYRGTALASAILSYYSYSYSSSSNANARTIIIHAPKKSKNLLVDGHLKFEAEISTYGVGGWGNSTTLLILIFHHQAVHTTH
jgi:hypothetical protein